MNGPVAIDANLLLLLVVGSTARDYIAKHKRLKNEYSLDDFDLLVQLVSLYSSIILLPNTLTEASNLLRHIDDPARTKIALTLQGLIAGCDETYVQSSRAASRNEYTKLGLTDAALLEFSSATAGDHTPTLLTADLDLAVAAEMKGYFVENFNHHRDVDA